MPFEFTEDELSRIEAIAARYPHRRAALIPVLHMAQKRRGYICADIIRATAQALGLTPAEVYGVVTFYTMFHLAPIGRHHIQVCTNVACMLRGSEQIVDVARRKCGVDLGDTSSDGRFTVEEVECLGACGTAPVVQVNEDYHESLSPESFGRLLDELK